MSHIHLVLQRRDRDEKSPLVDEAALKRIGRKHWLKVTISKHPKLRDSSRETDLRRFVADHLWRHDAEVLPPQGVRTNFDKDRPKTEKVKTI
jgi:hypothetical protein